MTYTVHEAKTNLSKLLKRAAAGEEVVIANDTEPVAKLVPIGRARKKRTPGRFKGKIKIHASFFDEMSPEDIKAWGFE